MAFVPSLSLKTTSTFGATLNTKAPTTCSTTRMTGDGTGKGEYGKAGKSMWKENYFTGGMPGGEAFYLAWIKDGMTKDVPDMPDSLQARSEYTAPDTEKKGLLGMLDRTEFFSNFIGQKEQEPVEVDSTDPSVTAVAVSVPKPEDGPDPALFEQYYPEATRYLAPEININYEKNFLRDRVSLAMTEVTASATDVYFPKDTKGKAPIIEIFYNGRIGSAGVSVKFDHVEGLPTLPPPASAGQAVTTLVPGPGGGLKLNYAVDGAVIKL